MVRVFVNQVGIAVPPNEVHGKFSAYAPSLLSSERDRRLFARMAERSGIERRYSVLRPDPDPARLDEGGFYRRGAFPDTGRRMAVYRREGRMLAWRAAEALGEAARDATHLIVTSCTGFHAPGPDLDLLADLGLKPSVERTVVGFMGCYAAINALKLARHIVRSEPRARVLVVTLELCTLHLQETDDLERVLSFLLFADGASASLVTAEERGLELLDFRADIMPGTRDHIVWAVGAGGFDMYLSGAVPAALRDGLHADRRAWRAGPDGEPVALWAVHPGGRTVLDAVEQGLTLDGALAPSREALRRYGNLSSTSIMVVLKSMMDAGSAGLGRALAFGPGVTAESLTFRL